MDLTLVSAAVIVFGVIVYVILDGFDLGVGILFPFAAHGGQRDVMMNSIAPFWDGNETWLILGGAVLFAAFPLAYAVALPAFYIPVMALLFALIFRGVAFEFRAKARGKRIWDAAFAFGSTLAAFAQGVLLGALVSGVTVEGRSFAGGPFDWLTPVAVAAGFGVVAGYGLLGATWLVLKTEGGLQAWARRASRFLVPAVLMFMGLVSLITPLTRPEIAERWFGGMNLLYLSPVPVLTLLVAALLWHGAARHERSPFYLAILLFLFGYLGVGISLWPNIVPPSISIYDAAAPRSSQVFVLIAVAVTLPMVFVYTWYAYRVFRGKVSAEGGYGH